MNTSVNRRLIAVLLMHRHGSEEPIGANAKFDIGNFIKQLCGLHPRDIYSFRCNL